MNVAVTGASGHVGANLVRALVARGDRVRVLVRDDDRAVRGLPVTVVRGDVRDAGSIGQLIDGSELVFNLAAKISLDPREASQLEAPNVEGPRTVVRACLESGARLVHFSSIHALSTHDGPIDESRPLADTHRFAYDRSKARAEREVLAGVAQGLHAVIVNPTAIVGPFDFKPSHAGRLLMQFARGRVPVVIDGGFNWVDVRDVVSGAIAASERGRPGERYLLTGTWTSLLGLATVAAGVAGARPPRLALPAGMARFGLPFSALFARVTGRPAVFTGESLGAVVNHRDIRRDKAERELGYRARPLEESVRDTYQWFRESGAL
jgi:dihydroflavonol-4-reductase